jgi:hypothetical protein
MPAFLMSLFLCVICGLVALLATGSLWTAVMVLVVSFYGWLTLFFLIIIVRLRFQK